MINFAYKERYGFDDLVNLMQVLRKECPWDREQTHESIRQNLLEEAYEVCEGIDTGDVAILREELGDLFLQVLFHVTIEEEQGRLDFGDVFTELAEKLIRRHPNIFAADGSSAPKTAEQMLDEWDRIKREEKGGHAKTVSAVAKSLPALMRAEKIQSRALKAGFGFRTADEAWNQFEEEASELRAATGRGSLEDELGDVIFTAVNIARLNGLDAELALERSCEKFTRRYEYMQSKCGDLSSLTDEEREKLWNEAKRNDRSK